MSYYYITQDGDFVDSSKRLDDPKYVQINEQEYAITRLVVRGYSRAEIEYAVDRVFRILSPANKVLHTDVAICEDCKKDPALEGCSVCAECGL